MLIKTTVAGLGLLCVFTGSLPAQFENLRAKAKARAGAKPPVEKAVKAAVPSVEAQGEALELIQELFSEEYKATDAEERLALAKELLKQARQTDNDPAAQFVLYREARALAAAAGEVEIALSAVADAAEHFDVVEDEAKALVFAKVLTTSKSPDTAQTVADEASAMARRALFADDFTQAAAYLKLAETAAKRTKNVALVSAVRQQRSELTSAQERYAKLGEFVQLLEKEPANTQANLELGKYSCFRKGDWTAGLARLAKGGNATLRELASATLADPKVPEEQLDLAGRWWAVAEKLTGTEREHVRLYSLTWYKQSLPGLSGLQKTLAEKRIAQVEQAIALRIGKRVVNLVPLIDLSRDVIDGDGKWRIEGGVLQCVEGDFWPGVQIPYQPPEEYDFTITVSQRYNRNGISMVIPAGQDAQGKHSYCAWTFGWGDACLFGGEQPFTVPKVLPPETQVTMLLQVRRTGLKVYKNGKPLAQHDGNWKQSKVDREKWPKLDGALALGCDDPTTFHAVQLIETRGAGKKLAETKDKRK